MIQGFLITLLGKSGMLGLRRLAEGLEEGRKRQSHSQERCRSKVKGMSNEQPEDVLKSIARGWLKKIELVKKPQAAFYRGRS